MIISPARAALGLGCSQVFEGSAGTGPYTYSLESGAGSINSVTGIYTAPNSIPAPDDDPIVVRATDSLGAFSEADLTVGSAIQLVCDIIQQEMGLADGRVYLWDQKINMPTDHDLFIAVSELRCKIIGNNRVEESTAGGMQEVLSTNFNSQIEIDIISRGPEARERKAEVLQALQSDYAQQQMALNSFRVFNIPSDFVNISNEDGAAILYRFNITVGLQYFVKKVSSISYYDTFTDPTVDVDV